MKVYVYTQSHQDGVSETEETKVYGIREDAVKQLKKDVETFFGKPWDAIAKQDDLTCESFCEDKVEVKDSDNAEYTFEIREQPVINAVENVLHVKTSAGTISAWKEDGDSRTGIALTLEPEEGAMLDLALACVYKGDMVKKMNLSDPADVVIAVCDEGGPTGVHVISRESVKENCGES